MFTMQQDLYGTFITDKCTAISHTWPHAQHRSEWHMIRFLLHFTIMSLCSCHFKDGEHNNIKEKNGTTWHHDDWQWMTASMLITSQINRSNYWTL